MKLKTWRLRGYAHCTMALFKKNRFQRCMDAVFAIEQVRSVTITL